MLTVNNNKVLAFLHQLFEAASSLWWSFFDWVAIVSWKRLALFWLLAIVATGMLGIQGLAGNFILISLAVKVLAGGKRKAELLAKQASAEANVADLGRMLAEARMSNLQAQIEPHFLFNTLAMIGQLIETDPKHAAKIHTNLVNYLRATIPLIRNAGSVTIGSQLELSRNYLSIMQVRMGERLNATFETPSHLSTAPFPSMMLQLLIENAIKHGLEPKVEGGNIHVRVAAAGNTLQVDVEDDGLGFSPFSKEGIGLANIRERLKLTYQGHAEFIIRPRPEGGTYASIRVPLCPEPIDQPQQEVQPSKVDLTKN